MKKATIYFIILLSSCLSFGQKIKYREFKDVPYPNWIETVEFYLFDINLDDNLVGFKHVFNLVTTYDETGEIYEKPCDCGYQGMKENPFAGVVLGVYDLENQEYLKTFTIYNATYDEKDCFDFETSSKKLDSAKKYFKEKNMDITMFEIPFDLEMTSDLIGINFTFTNKRTMNDDLTSMVTISQLNAEIDKKKTIYTVYQDDYYIMASGGNTEYVEAYTRGDKIFFLSIFDYFTALAGTPNCQTYQFSPVFSISELKKELKK